MKELWTAICNNFGVIVGVLGSLGGTILGWWLNNVSKRGKLKFIISKWIEEFKYNYQGHIVKSKSFETAEYYEYNLILDIYNDSSDVKILRNIHIEFVRGKELLQSFIPKDESTVQRSQHFTHYDEVSPININPKSIYQLSLHNGLWKKDNSFDFITKTQTVWFVYNDENNREKRIKITTIQREEMFDSYFLEEQKNA